jgi:hypothetical protein
MAQFSVLEVRHLDRDDHRLEADVNEAVRRIVAQGGVIAEIEYAGDPSSDPGRLGAVIIYELPRDVTPA